mmetsp:Transcript_16759/g.38923  ORF Transcript_16759/g.38923 Transcript_16759/m.38923 type:complete len:92 (-) Transcript_16759:12-287(-)
MVVALRETFQKRCATAAPKFSLVAASLAAVARSAFQREKFEIEIVWKLHTRAHDRRHHWINVAHCRLGFVDCSEYKNIKCKYYCNKKVPID